MRKFALLIVALLISPFTLPAAEQDRRQELAALSQRIAAEVEALRGTKFKEPVKTDFILRKDLIPRFLKDIAEEYPQERIDADEAFLHTIGAIPPNVKLLDTMLDALSGAVGGFYDPKENTFYIVEEVALNFPRSEFSAIIAHELTHALDDDYHGLQAITDTVKYDEDRGFAASSLFEGSARSLETVYRMEQARKPRDPNAPPDGAMIISPEEMASQMRFISAPPYFHTMLAKYSQGAKFLQHRISQIAQETQGEKDSATEAAIQAGVLAQAIAKLPTSSEQILHPEKYWDDATRDEPILVDSTHFISLLQKAGLKTRHEQTAGEIICAIIATNPQASGLMSDNWTNKPGAGWGGDRFFLLESPEGSPEHKAVWVTLWDTPADREEFITAYTKARGDKGLSWIAVGENTAVILYNLSKKETDTLHTALFETPLKLTRAGQPWESN